MTNTTCPENRVIARLKLDNVILRYACIYTPKQFSPTSKLKYSQAMEYDGAELRNHGMYARDNGIYSLSSLWAPQINVIDGDYKRLVDALDIAKARNLPVDKMFTGFEISATLELYKYDGDGFYFADGVAASLLSITIDMDKFLERME